MRIYCISSRGKQKRGGPPAWGLREVLTIPRHKHWPCYETDICRRPRLTLWYNLNMAKGQKIWYLEYKELVKVSVNYDSSQGISEVLIRFSGCTRG